MGDEYANLYFVCDHCGAYTVETISESFLGEEQHTFKGPSPRAEGDAKVALIAQCQRRGTKSADTRPTSPILETRSTSSFLERVRSGAWNSPSHSPFISASQQWGRVSPLSENRPAEIAD